MSRDYHISYKNFRIINNTHKFYNAYNLRAKCGVFSDKDKKYCHLIEQRLTDANPELRTNNFFTILNKINLVTSQVLSKTIKRGIFLYYKNSEEITSSLLKRIRFENFKYNILDNIKNANNIVNLPYINICLKNKTPKILQYNHKDSYIIHPRQKINNIIKDNDCDVNFCKKYAKMLNKTPLKDLINQKIHITQKMLTFLNKTNNTYDFVFSKNELNEIKLLANKYDTIENLLLCNRIHTGNIEKLIFNITNRNIKEGDTLLNGDILLQKTKIYDKHKKSDIDAIVTFANTDRGYRFKIYKYDKDLFNKIPQITRQYKHYIKTNNIRNINTLNTKLTNLLKDDEIAEVFLEEYSQNEMKKLMQEDNLISPQTIEQLIPNNNRYYYVKNLKNFNLKKYQNVSLTLIKCLKEFGRINLVKRAFLEAFSFNNIKHSPVFLYLRAGCMPISHSKEELEKFLRNGFDFKKNVWLMYDIK